MPEVIAQIAGPAMLGMAGAGTAGNIYSQVEAGETAGLQKQKLQDQLKYINNPALLSQLIQSLTTPLSESLIQSLGRSSNAMAGQAGLGDSPGLVNYIAGQAAAPYAEQSQQNAIQLAMNSIFGPTQTPNFPTSNMSGLYAMLGQKYPGVFSTANPNTNSGGISDFSSWGTDTGTGLLAANQGNDPLAG